MWLRVWLLPLGVLAWILSGCGEGRLSSSEPGPSAAPVVATSASAEQQRSDARYRFEWRRGLRGEHAWIAEHPLMGLRSEFGRGQVLLHPPGAGAAPGLSLHAAAWGCPDAFEDLPVREPNRSPKLDEIRFGDAGAQVVEWYRHRENGLEQGFTVSKLPACAEASGRLLIVLERSPGWSSSVADDHSEATFSSASGAKVRYSDAYARGALGGAHAVQIVALEDRVALEIDTQGVVLPLEIDPLAWTEQQKVTASDAQDSDFLGHSVALSGNLLASGAPGDDDKAAGAGAVYAHTRTGTTWGGQQKILASDGAANDNFGSSVAITSTYLAAGANLDDDGGASSGAVYVYTRTGSAWGGEKKVVAPDAQAGDQFGCAVALDGTTLLVGAAFDDDLGSNAGAAYVFTFNGSNWVFQQKLTASDAGADANDNFGTSVALSGNSAIVGSPFDSDVASYAGAAYVFLRTGTTWAQQQKLVDDAKADDFAGEAVAIDGDSAVIGAFDNGDKAAQAGTAWVWTRSGTAWSMQKKLFPKDPMGTDQFGDSVAIRGDVAVIGATGDDSFKGSAYAFTRAGTVWTETTKLQAADGKTNHTFGISLSLDGTTVAIGAEGFSVAVPPDPTTSRGATYLETLTDGSTCVTDSDCRSGHCVEAVCCNSACTNTCQSCLASRKLSGADGVCGNIKNDTDPRSGCATQTANTCGTTGVCNGSGACTLFASGTQCVAAACVGTTSVNPKDSCNGSGVCQATATAACDRGYQCEAGACHTNCTAGNEATNCDTAKGFKCIASECKIPQGSACTVGGDCETDICTDGVCCDEACDDPCHSCLGADKGSDVSTNGVCGIVAPDTDPALECEADGTPCGKEGVCDEKGSCRSFAKPTKECGPTACDAGVVSGQLCDGEGNCADNPGQACAPYLCSGAACATGCGLDTDCTEGVGFCDTANKCQQLFADGVQCGLDHECQSGHCADGFCCNTACTGQCEACGEEKAEGKCVAVQNEPRGERPACDVAPAGQACQEVSCNGKVRDMCAGYVGSTVVCQDPKCTDGLASGTGLCNGAGECAVDAPQGCGAYQCGETACLTECTKNDDCVGNNRCIEGKCGAGARCSQDLTALVDADGNAESCAPFLCQGEACLTTCTASTDCADSSLCNTESHQCEAVSAVSTSEDSGCGCRAPARGPGHGWVVLAGLSLLALRRKRRSAAA